MPENYVNATTYAVSGISDISWFATVIIVSIVAVILMLFVITLSNLSNYIRTKKCLMSLVNTFKYFLFGCLTLIVLFIPSYVAYHFIKEARQGNIIPLKVTLSIIVGYFVIALIGYLSKRLIYDRIKKFEQKIKKSK